jgi:hypothetical protein
MSPRAPRSVRDVRSHTNDADFTTPLPRRTPNSAGCAPPQPTFKGASLTVRSPFCFPSNSYLTARIRARSFLAAESDNSAARNRAVLGQVGRQAAQRIPDHKDIPRILLRRDVGNRQPCLVAGAARHPVTEVVLANLELLGCRKTSRFWLFSFRLAPTGHAWPKLRAAISAKRCVTCWNAGPA